MTFHVVHLTRRHLRKRGEFSKSQSFLKLLVTISLKGNTVDEEGSEDGCVDTGKEKRR